MDVWQSGLLAAFPQPACVDAESTRTFQLFHQKCGRFETRAPFQRMLEALACGSRVSGMQVRLCDQILRLLACFRLLSIRESLAEVHDRGVRPASVESQCAEGIECIVCALNCQRSP